MTEKWFFIIIGVAIVISIAIGIYSVFYNTDEQARQTQKEECQKELAKSIIIQNFMLSAAEARRTQAASETNPALVEANLATAAKYELYARQTDSLTTKDC